jgi:hypothetical protein
VLGDYLGFEIWSLEFKHILTLTWGLKQDEQS